MKRNKKIDKQINPVPAIVHGLSHDGRGIATIANKTTFITGALPGETVTYQLTKKRSTYHEADAAEIVAAGPMRATPPCQHAGLCGGCNLQHMNMGSQIELKQKTLLEQLKHFGKVMPLTILPPLNSITEGYRRKARLGVKFVIKKDKLLVGFREKSSKYLADLERCAVLHPNIGERLTELSALILSLEQYQHIPQIEVAMGDTDTALVFRHMEALPESDQDKLISFGKKYDFHIYLQPNAPAAIHPIWAPDNTRAPERLTYTLPEYDLEFLFHPLDFTQINLELNRLMVKQAMDLLDPQPNETILDLFCGIGNFTLPIARHAHQVVGVEGSDEMVIRATQNAVHNHITNASFYAANLENPPADAPWRKLSYDKVLIDPPRVGAKEILPFIGSLNAKRIVYVSCNPATLARDAGELVNQYGYQLTQAGIMNMFPHTAHVEAMAIFDKGNK